MKTTLLEPITSTIYGSELQTCQLANIPYPMREHTTLNEKFNILSGIAHSANSYPTLRYIAIGNGGHKAKVGNNGIEIGEILQHKPTDAALFNHIPFVAREPNNDLTPQEREKFALRRLETHNGVRVIVYYLRRLDMVDVTTQLQYHTVVDKDNIKTTAFVPTQANLKPVPQPLQEVGVNTLNGDYVRCETVLSLNLDAWDLDELKNAANLIYGDERYAVISEVGLVSAIDKVTEGSGAGSSNFNYKEVISAQVCAFVATDFRAYFHNSKVGLIINIGASEPMYKLVAP